MRLLLDADISSEAVGRLLIAGGHDVGALDQEPGLDALDDEQVLELAQRDGSILVTHNTADMPCVLRDWLGAGRSHAGVILVNRHCAGRPRRERRGQACGATAPSQ